MANFTAGAVLTASALNSAFNTATINAQTTAYTFGTADAGELVTVNNNSGGTVTIPANATWGAATGTIIGVLNAGTAGSWTIGTAAGVTLNANSASLAPLESGQLVKTATNTWYFTKGGPGKASVTATTGSPTVTTVSGKTCYQFTGSGSVTIGAAGLVDALIIGGGGGARIGGGGAGGHRYLQNIYLPSGTITCTVGGGGGPGVPGSISALEAGGVSIYNAIGGGFGGFVDIAYGQGGGSGGGSHLAGIPGGPALQYGGAGGAGGGTDAQGGGGGGGGSSAAGAAANVSTGGAGGNGTANSITGTSVTRAGGGGGGGFTAGGAGGSGGGGAGTKAGTGGSGTANTGSGGGGAFGGTEGSGGSGLIILLVG